MGVGGGAKGETCLGDAGCSKVGVKDESYVGASIDVGVSKAGTHAWEGGVSGRGGRCMWRGCRG